MEDKRGTDFAEENAAEETAHETAAAEEAPDIEMTENPDAESDEEEDAAASEYNDTASQYSDLEDALSEANEKYVRLFAEYDNYRKRTSKEKIETYSNATVKCIETLLPVIDSFERSVESDCSDENYKNGMEMIFNQLKDFLAKMGVSEVGAPGDAFDPKVHNAISQQDGTEFESNHVCAVYQKGYTLGDKLIRPAMVAVAQ